MKEQVHAKASISIPSTDGRAIPEQAFKEGFS